MSLDWWFPYLFGLAVGSLNGWLNWGRKLRKVRKAVDVFEDSLRARSILTDPPRDGRPS